MKTQKHLSALTILLLISVQLMAGWVITSERDEGFGIKEIETIYIQDDKFKTATENDIVILNFKTEVIYLINPINQSYWSGTLSEFKTSMVNRIKSKMQNVIAIEKVPAEHREMYEKMYQEIIDKIENEEINTGTDLEVKETSDNMNIIGYSADKYQFWQEGILREDIWIAEKLKISDELNFEKFKQLFMSFTNVAPERSVEGSPKYLELVETGYPIKTVEYKENFKIVTTATNIEKKQIADSEFLPPSDYNEISIMDLWEND